MDEILGINNCYFNELHYCHNFLNNKSIAIISEVTEVLHSLIIAHPYMPTVGYWCVIVIGFNIFNVFEFIGDY